MTTPLIPHPFHRISQAAFDVAMERQRQQTVEGYTAEHDDAHVDGSLVLAARCYAAAALSAQPTNGKPPEGWPWDKICWKPAGPRRMLIKAQALLQAEVERQDRRAAGAADSQRAVLQPLGSSEIQVDQDNGATGFLYRAPLHVAMGGYFDGQMAPVRAYTAGRWTLIQRMHQGIAWYALGPTGGWLVFADPLTANDWVIDGRAAAWEQWGRH